MMYWKGIMVLFLLMGFPEVGNHILCLEIYRILAKKEELFLKLVDNCFPFIINRWKIVRLFSKILNLL
jgi:hypothetical protein